MSCEMLRNELPSQILEEAASWLVEFNDGELDTAQRTRFNEWIRRSPDHLRAYFEMSGVWEESERLDPHRETEPQKLIAEALAASNVHFFEPRAAIGEVARPRRPSTARMLIFAASVLLAVGIGGVMVWSQRHLYSTDTGEQRSVVLPDGTTVELNSESTVRVAFTATSRIVELIKGQALFDVQSDPKRPFEVESGVVRVRAIGTQFDVYRKRQGTVVTVLEGRVAVLPLSSSSDRAATVIVAGEQLTVAREVPPTPSRTNVAAATAWTERKLVFDETPLAEAVEEINRYNSRRLVIEDPQLSGFHIRGTFNATEPELLVQFLQKRFKFSVQESRNEIRLSEPPRN